MHELIADCALAFGVAAVTALLLTPLVGWLARRVGMVDKPDARRIHTQPTPRGGGLAVFIGFHLALQAVRLLGHGTVSSVMGADWEQFFLITSSILVGVGILDDALGLKPWLKLAGQIVVATLLYGSGARVGSILWFQAPAGLDYALTVGWFVGIINAFNLIDGMDGLAAGLAIIASAGLTGSLLARNMTVEVLPLVALAGACLGFLRYNFHPASIFLGDTGSMFLGLLLATIPLYTAAKQEFLASVGVPLLAIGVPLFDTILAVWRRSVRSALPEFAGDGHSGRRVMQADKEHLHHRILALGINQRRAALLLYGLNAVLVTVGIFALIFRARASGIFLLGFIVVAYIVVRHLSRVELWDTGRALLSSVRARKASRLAVPLYLLADILSLMLVWLASRKLANLPVTGRALASQLPMLALPVLLSLAASHTYRRVWSRSRTRDYALLSLALLVGCIGGFAFVILMGAREPGWSRQALIFTMAVQFPILAIRLGRELLAEFVASLERQRLLEEKDTERVLAYGGGTRFRLYVREGRAHIGRNRRVIVGIIDDDVTLRHRVVDGFEVFGGIEDLAEVVATHRIRNLVITAQISDAQKRALAEKARLIGVRLTEWDYEERELVARKQDS